MKRQMRELRQEVRMWEAKYDDLLNQRTSSSSPAAASEEQRANSTTSTPAATATATAGEGPVQVQDQVQVQVGDSEGCGSAGGMCRVDPTSATNSDVCVYNAAAAGKCTGKSTGLSTIACNTWQILFDAWGGLKWYECNDTKTDPCSCSYGGLVTCQGADIVEL